MKFTMTSTHQLAAAVALATGLITHARADDCAPVTRAMFATLKVGTGYRQFMTTPNRPERLFSVAVGNTVYMNMGPNRWMKMSRDENIATATQEGGASKYSNCIPSGKATVDGVSTTVYEFTFLKSRPIKGRVWVGGDGLLRKQEVAGNGAFIRYEYNNVVAPEK